MLRRALPVLLLVSLAASAAAQTFERFGVRDGLTSEAVMDLDVGPLGYLWVATEDGLSRYDGHGFRSYRHRPGRPETLPSSRLGAVLAAESGVVWVGSVQGLAGFDRRSGRFEAIPGLPRRAYVTSLEEDAQGRIWVGTQEHGLWRYNPAAERMARIGLLSRRQSGVRVITVAHDGQDIWASAFHSDEVALCKVTAVPMECERTTGHPGPGHLLNMGEEAVLVVDDKRALQWIPSGVRWPMVGVPEVFRAGARVQPRVVWIGSQRGIVTVQADGTTGVIQPDPDARSGLGGFIVRSLVRDRQGSIWVGTEAGLYVARAPSGPFETFRHSGADRATLSDDRVNGMAEQDGVLWVTTNDGLNRLDLQTGRVRRFNVRAPQDPSSPYATSFWQVLVTRAGEVLVGGKRHGVLRLEGERLVPVGEPLLETGVRGLAEDQDGRIWIMTETGVWRLGLDGRIEAVPTGPAPGPTNAAHIRPNGHLWIAGDRGLLRYDPRRDRLEAFALTCESGRDIADIWSIVETPADPGALWLASVGSGLVRYEPATGETECAGLTWGLPTDAIPSALVDEAGMVWAGTSAGLVRLDPTTRDVTTFTSADGLQGDAFNLMAAHRLSDGRLAFGGPGGLTLVDPAVVTAREAPAVVVSGFERSGRLDAGTPLAGDTLRVPHDAGSFGVRFAAVDFRAPRKNRYRYRLVGLEDEWQRTDGAAPRAAFAGVPPGSYRFEVEGAAADTPYGEPATLWIEVEPAVWQQWWFRWGLGLLAVGLVAGVGVRTARRKAAEAARAEADALEVRRRLADARERERLRLARDLHDGPVQNLYSVGHDLDRLGEAGAEIGPVRSRVGDVATSLRQMLVELRPTIAEHLGLGPALRTVSRHAEERWSGISVTVLDQTDGARPTDAGRVALFRIGQQALDNAGRHAGAARVEVVLEAARGGIAMTIRDDGRGFVVPDRMVDLARREHFGLVGSRERAEAVGGTFEVQSVPGEGTTVTAWVPAADLEVEGENGS